MVTFFQYSLVSTLTFLGVILYAFCSRGQFYTAMVYLSTSKFSLLAASNMFVFLLLFTLATLQAVFLGSLREVEVERLHELFLHELMETALAMTIFREKFDIFFGGMFATLMATKILHWLCQKRVDYIETTPAMSWVTHLRIFSFMCFLIVIDSLFFYRAVLNLIENEVRSVWLLFVFEFFILTSSTVVTMIKYIMCTADLILDGHWDSKPIYVFYLEFFRDILHLTAYTIFFFVVFKYYGIPLHLIRDLYETFRNFRTRIADFVRYRRITSNLNERFVDATPEEISRGDSTCIICREEMSSAKKLPCGHIFHMHCLRSWIERQQSCPTCRASLLENNQQGNLPNQQPNVLLAPGNFNFVVQRFFRLNQDQNQNQNENQNQNQNQNQDEDQNQNLYQRQVQQPPQPPPQDDPSSRRQPQTWPTAPGTIFPQQNLHPVYQDVTDQNQMLAQYYQQLAQYYHNQSAIAQRIPRGAESTPTSRLYSDLVNNPTDRQNLLLQQQRLQQLYASIPATSSFTQGTEARQTPGGVFPNTNPFNSNASSSQSSSSSSPNHSTSTPFYGNAGADSDAERTRRMMEYYYWMFYGPHAQNTTSPLFYGYYPANYAYLYSPSYLYGNQGNNEQGSTSVSQGESSRQPNS